MTAVIKSISLLSNYDILFIFVFGDLSKRPSALSIVNAKLQQSVWVTNGRGYNRPQTIPYLKNQNYKMLANQT